MFLYNFILYVIFCVYVNALVPNDNFIQQIRENLDEITQDVLTTQGHVMWHSYRFHSGIGNREELEISNIKSDNTFNIGQEVTEWQSINIRSKSYAVGRMSSGFTILTTVLNPQKSGFVTTSKIIIFKEIPTAFTLFQKWNDEDAKFDIILIVALNDINYDLLWYRITDDINLELIWAWNIQKKISHLKVFRTDQFLKLLVINENRNAPDTVTGDIYDFILNKNLLKFWLYQSLLLKCTAKSSAVNQIASRTFLSIPQNCTDSVHIYEHQNDRFIPFTNIRSDNVEIVVDFQIGSRSFLAIGGQNFTIYHYGSDSLIKEEILDRNFEKVTFILAAPIKTYRDEIVLFVQHHLNYGSHGAPSVEVFTYSNKKFTIHDEMPCTDFGQLSHGASCLADVESDLGIYGSAFLTLDKVLGILVPRVDISSGLFIIEWKLISKTYPLIKEIDKVVKKRIEIQKLLNQQHQEVLNIKQKLSNVVKLNQNNNITAPWIIDTLIVKDTLKFENQDVSKKPNTYFQNSSLFDLETGFEIFEDELDLIQNDVLRKRSTNIFENLTIFGNLEVKGRTELKELHVTEIDGYKFEDLIQNCAKRNENSKITGTKVFKDMKVDNINFEFLNNISAQHFVYESGSPIRFTGNVIFTKPFIVKENVDLMDGGTVNGIKLKDELVYLDSNKPYESLQFQNVQSQSVIGVKYINDEEINMFIQNDDNNNISIELNQLDLTNKNITIEHLNRLDANDFFNDLCFTNQNYSLLGTTTIIGDLYVRGSAKIETLNDLKYPEEYLMSKEEGFTKITGKKVFMGNVSVTEVDTKGLVNDVDLDTIITLSLNQTISGNFTFSELEVTESIRVDGSIFRGPNHEKFTPKPTLETANILDTNVIFNKLEVEGDVIVSELFGNKKIEDIFEDIIYKDEMEAVINAQKNFTGTIKVETNLDIISNKINNVDLNDVITIHTEQIIAAEEINGHVIIDNLELHGFYNNENITEILENIIRIDQDQIVYANVTFQNFDDYPDIVASNLHINNLNNLASTDFVLITDNRIFEEDVEFENIEAEKVIILTDFNYEFEEFDIKEFDKKRFSLKREQNITGYYKILNGNAENISTEYLNGYHWNYTKKFVNISEMFAEKFVNGQFEITNLFVNGSLTVDFLNNINMSELFNNVFWLNKSNNITTKVILENEVVFSDLIVDHLNDVKFQNYISDIVLKNETNVTFYGFKTFEQGFVVNNLNTAWLNDLKVDDILLKTGNQTVLGHVIIHGDVWIENNLDVQNYVNGVSIKFLKDNFRMENGNFILKGDVTFNDKVSVHQLQVQGFINGIKPEKHLGNIVGIYDDIELNSTVTFQRKVHIRKNLGVATTINGVDLEKFVNDVVWIFNDDFINSMVTFTQNVVTNTVDIDSDLKTKTLCGFDVQNWEKNAVYLSDGFLNGSIKFEKISVFTNLEVEFLNEVDMSKLIPLASEQYINETLNIYIMEIENDVEVGNLINKQNFETEFANTVLSNVDQEIESEIIFKDPVTIQKDLNTSGVLNGTDLRRLVTTDTDQNLTASYVFDGKVIIDADLHVSGKVNDINIATDWQQRAVTVFDDAEQNITDSWTVSGNITFLYDVDGSGRLGGINITEMEREVERKQRQKYAVENAIRNDYRNVCSAIQDLLRLTKMQPFLFKHFEYHQQLQLQNTIGAIHYFEYKNRYFLLMHQHQSCYTTLYEWILDTFEELVLLDTGAVEQFLTVNDSTTIYLVTKNADEDNCNYNGTNIWIFNINSLLQIYTLPNVISLHDSNFPGSFYALDKTSMVEYRLFFQNEEVTVYPFKKWDIPKYSDIFTPITTHPEITLWNDDVILKLSPDELMDMESNTNSTTITGNVNVVPNRYLPAGIVGEVIVFNVDAVGKLLQFTAVTVLEESTVGSQTDDIKIYENIEEGTLFDKIQTFKPTNLIALNFGYKGQTLLVFLEDYNTLQIYEFKGNKGFKHRSSTQIQATKMISVSLPVASFESKRHFLLLINNSSLTVIQAIMDGDRPTDNLHCDI